MNRRRRIWATVFITIVLVLALSSASFTAGFAVGHSNSSSNTALAQPTSSVPGFDVFWQAWDLVQKNYVDQKAVNNTTLTYGAIQGMINALGDVGHSRFLTPSEL